MTNLDDLTKRRPPDWETVAAHEKRMLAETRAYRLRELREQFDLTPVDTLRRYLQALGGRLEVAVSFGDESYKIA